MGLDAVTKSKEKSTGEPTNIPRISIVNFGMGNLFSVKHACELFGLKVSITCSPDEIFLSDVVILPGVGAFGDAMKNLQALDLITVLREVANSSRLFLGICLGMQLLMTESHEFGHHRGLGIIEGSVEQLNHPKDCFGEPLKVPHVGWNRIYRLRQARGQDPWKNTLLEGLEDGAFMYFVHSFYVKPEDPHITLSFTRYGEIEFCSSLQCGNIFACQFHPERSGREGLEIYKTISSYLKHRAEGARSEGTSKS
jgi:glutamine amidotransferase